jgi:hypothetical protein
MLRKLPGLIWTTALLAFVVKRFVPPESIRAFVDTVRGAAADPAPSMLSPSASANGAEVHTPLPVA